MEKRRRRLNILPWLIVLTSLVISSISIVKLISLERQLDEMNFEIKILKQQQQMNSEIQDRIIADLQKFMSSWKVNTFEVTAYSPLDNRNKINADSDAEHMSTMVKTRDNIDTAIAVDPKVIPYHSKVYIEGIGWREALDTGGAIKGNKIDVPMRTYQQAINFGKQNLLVVLPNK